MTGFEPATSSSRTTRATKLRHIPLALRDNLSSNCSMIADRRYQSNQKQTHHLGLHGYTSYEPAVSVTRTASGGQKSRTGAKREVPRPAET